MSPNPPYRGLADWPLVRIGDVTTKIGSGSTPRGGAESYLPKRETFALVRSQCVFDRWLDTDSLSFISDSQADKMRSVEVRPDDILLNITGDGVTFARAAQVPAEILPAVVNQHVAIVRADPELALAGYLLSYLTNPATKVYMGSFSSGGSRRAITKGHIESFVVPLPPLETQHRIVSVLGTLDDKIESNRRAIRLISDLLDTQSQELESKYSRVPLGDLVSVNRETVDPKRLGRERIDYYSLPAFDAGFGPETVRADSIKSSKIQVRSTSILLSRLNPRINRSWWVGSVDEVPALASTEFSCFEMGSENALAGLWLALRTKSFRDELPSRVTGTSGSHQRVRHDDLLSIEVMDFRALDEGILARTLGLLMLKQTLVRQIRDTSSLRDAVLPELLSGRLRIPDAATVT